MIVILRGHLNAMEPLDIIQIISLSDRNPTWPPELSKGVAKRAHDKVSVIVILRGHLNCCYSKFKLIIEVSVIVILRGHLNYILFGSRCFILCLSDRSYVAT